MSPLFAAAQNPSGAGPAGVGAAVAVAAPLAGGDAAVDVAVPVAGRDAAVPGAGWDAVCAAVTGAGGDAVGGCVAGAVPTDAPVAAEAGVALDVSEASAAFEVAVAAAGVDRAADVAEPDWSLVPGVVCATGGCFVTRAVGAPARGVTGVVTG